MKAHVRPQEDELLVLQERDGSVRYEAVPGEDPRSIHRAGRHKLLLGEADPHQHRVAGRALTPGRSGRNALRIRIVSMEVQRRLWGSVVVEEVVRAHVLEAEDLRLEEELVRSRPTSLPTEGRGSAPPCPPPEGSACGRPPRKPSSRFRTSEAGRSRDHKH